MEVKDIKKGDSPIKDTTKVTGTGGENKGAKPMTIKLATGQEMKHGDQQHAKKLVSEIRGGEVKLNGKPLDPNSPTAKGLIAEINSLGQGDTPAGAKKIGQLTASQAAEIAKTRAVMQNMENSNAARTPATTVR